MQDRDGHEDNATPAFAVVKASIPEATDTENLLPRNAGGVHPFSGTPPCALSCPEVSFFVVFAKGVGDPTVVPLSEAQPVTHHSRRRFLCPLYRADPRLHLASRPNFLSVITEKPSFVSPHHATQRVLIVVLPSEG